MVRVVTGAAGFIGSRLCEEILATTVGPVIGIDRFSAYYSRQAKEANLAGLAGEERFTLLEEDLADPAALLRLSGAIPPGEEILLYHLAAQAGVRKSWGTDFGAYLRDNVAATQNLLEWAAGRGDVRNFLFASSSSVYGIPESLPMTEDVTVPGPHSPYGVTKLAAENLVRLYTANRGLPSVSLRFFTVYGPRQRPDMAFRRFLQALRTGEPIRIFGDGGQTRDFTYVDDTVRGLRLAETCTEGRVMNLGGGSSVRLLEAIRTMEEVTGIRAELEFLPVQAGDVTDTLASTALLERTTGWKPEVSLAEGLRREAAWLEISDTH